jgi:AcrR family transcriptional regulator
VIDPARQRILAAAGRQFARRGLLATTLDDIRRDAEVSVGSLYHHFAGKEDVYAAAWQAALEDYQQAFLAVLDRHAEAEAGVKAIVRQHLRWLAEHPDGAQLLLGSRPAGDATPQVEEANRAFFARMLAWWRTHAAYGTVRDLPLAPLYALWLGPAQEYGRIRTGRGGKVAPRDVDVLAEGAWLALRASQAPGDG